MRPLLLKNLRFGADSAFKHNADAIYINEGVIQAIGKFSDFSFPEKEISVEDLGGKYVYPSFTDAHIHLLEYGLSLQRVDCETDTKRECLNRVQSSVRRTPPDTWVLGHGWNQNIWEQGYGTKDDLDSISTSHPIYLTHKSLHCGWANSAALKRVGIMRENTQSIGAGVARDEDGEPTGLLFEKAMQLVNAVIPEPSTQDQVAAISSAQVSLNRFGITSVHDFDRWGVLKTIKEIRKNRTLSLRIIKSIPFEKMDHVIRKSMFSGNGDDWIKIGWLKLFADGALGPQTAAMFDPYEQTNSHGELFLDRKAIQEIGEMGLDHKIGLAVHAIGDLANHEVIAGFEKLAQKNILENSTLPNRIEHVQIIQEKDIGKFGKLCITASMQPFHVISDMEMADKYWGKRCSSAYAWKTVLENNTNLVFGSDAPVESPNPFLGLHASVLRKRSGLEKYPSWYPEQCISLKAAMTAYIKTPAELFQPTIKFGEIMPGNYADLIVLDHEISKIPVETIKDILPCATMLNGQWVYKE